MKKVNTNISVDPTLKHNATELFANFGLDFSTAISLFLAQSVREKRIPFEIRMETPNEKTMAALKEYSEMRTHKKKYKRYNSFNDVLKEIK
ncbi:MAG: type II toxin-antitoxin system RelB/DinJ family antitoxin [Bacilli bacterium]|nr:type II toxin-antitoxin system RelB/DinJ family antitoxin [Bacilli bacterium]